MCKMCIHSVRQYLFNNVHISNYTPINFLGLSNSFYHFTKFTFYVSVSINNYKCINNCKCNILFTKIDFCTNSTLMLSLEVVCSTPIVYFVLLYFILFSEHFKHKAIFYSTLIWSCRVLFNEMFKKNMVIIYIPISKILHT